MTTNKPLQIVFFIAFVASGICFNFAGANLITSSLFAAFFTLSLFSSRASSSGSFFIFLLLSALLVHYRSDVYFYFDEWTLIDLFMTDGWKVISHRHNEHFLPLFFSMLFLETKIYGINYYLYILTSIFLHAINALLIYWLCQKINISNFISKIISALFVVSSLHSEVLHWAFEQSLLVCTTFILLSSYFALNYFRAGKWKDLLCSFLFATLSPFIFGNGFSIVFILFLFWFTACPKLQYKRLFYLFLPIIFCFFVTSFFYFTKTNVSKAESVVSIFVYLFTGAQLGVVLRGLGLFPTIEIEKIPIYTVPEAFKFYPEFFYALYGLAISLIILVFAYSTNRSFVKIWLLGFSIPLVTIILPALTRAQLGAAQALSLRYDYLGVFGLFLMLVPVFTYLLENKKRKQVLVLIIISHVYLQLGLAKNYRYFSNYGIKHRAYVEALKQWKCSKAGAEKMPQYPETIYPGYKRKLMLEALDWFGVKCI